MSTFTKLSDAWKKLFRSKEDIIYSRRYEGVIDNHIRSFSSFVQSHSKVRKTADAAPAGDGLYTINVKSVFPNEPRKDTNFAYSAKDGRSLFTRDEAIAEIISLEKNFEAADFSAMARQPEPRLLAVNAQALAALRPTGGLSLKPR